MTIRSSTSSKRLAVRAGTLAALTSAPLLAAGSAFASNFQGEDAGPGLSVLATVGIFVGIPFALFFLITVLVLLPGWVRGDHNRNEIGWDSKSAARAKAALAKDQSSGTGASEEAKAGAASSGTGGASGTW